MKSLQLFIRWAWRLGLALLLVAMSLISSTPIGAQEEPEPARLSIGNWTGVAHAEGIATLSAEGLDFLWDGLVTGKLDIGVHDQTTVSGQWNHEGSATTLVEGMIEGRPARVEANVTFSGPGVIGGTPSLLQLDGSSRSIGSATISSEGTSITTEIGNDSQVPTLQVRILYALCDEAYGDWAWAIEQEFAEEGFTANLDGTFIALRDDVDIQENLRDLYDTFLDGPPDRSEDGYSPLFELVASYMTRVNNYIDGWPNWLIDDVMEALEEGEFLVNELRNLAPCERRFFGEDNVELFANALTFHIQQLIIGGAGLEGVSGEDIFKLMEAASRVGAMGPGAPFPAQAVRTENALHRAAQRILKDNLDPSDNRIYFNEDTQKAMLVGAIMDWRFVVGGNGFSARQKYENQGLDWQEGARQDGGGS